jgi:signal transduction histidine kinase
LGYDAAPPRTVIATPIAFRDSLVGVLLVASLRKLGEREVAFLEDAARQLAVGLENVRTYERVQQLLAEVGEKNQQIQAQNEELQAQNEEIQAQNEELQAQGEEIQVQNEQLKAQADALRVHAGSLAEQDRRKSEFLGVLAHELRNPMAAISNSLYALVKAGSEEQRGRAQDIIRRQTRFLGRLVDDLLDVTRISSGKVRLQKEPLDLAGVVRECSEDYRGMADKAGVKLDVEAPQAALPVHGDRTRLCQIVGNLLDNAIKFSNGGREVRVTLQAAGDRAELRVRDRGVGIEAPMLGRLFQPFSQAESSLARGKSGLGLGLALAKALAELHEGTIEALSEGPGKGAEFVVRLPLASKLEQPAPPPARRAGVHGRRVLIIEDNPDAALSLRDAMELAGHEVRVAYDPTEGIAIAREFRPEVLLCDIGLPTMDGYQVARRFRSDERLRSTYMIAVTGYAAPEDRARAAQAGFDRHLGKPPDIELLNQLLAEANPPGG